MNYLRTILLATIALTAVAAPTLLPSTAQAHPQGCQANARVYYLYYRTCPHDSWHYYGYTPAPQIAQYHLSLLQSNGYEVFYR